MNIQIKTTNIELTPEISTYVTKKFANIEKLLQRAPDSTLCHLDIGRATKHHKHGDVFHADVSIDIPGGKQVYAAADREDIFKAIDEVRDEALAELKKIKDKHVSSTRH